MTKEQLRDYQPIKRELTNLDALGRKLERHGTDELREVYERKRAKLASDLKEIEDAIATLGPTERTLMRLRYIDGLSWRAVCTRICYSWQQTHRIHAQALIKLKDQPTRGGSAGKE